MKLLTASAGDRAEKCPPSQSYPWALEVFPPAAEGTALHTYTMEVVLFGREKALANVPEEYRSRAARVDVSSLPHATGGYVFEVAFGYDFVADTGWELGREVKSRPEIEALYAQLDPDTCVGGTADLVGITDDAVVSLDLKTGRQWLPLPGKSLQLQILALAASRVYRKRRAVVGWIRLIDTQPVLVIETMGPLELEEARDRIIAVHKGVARFAELLEAKPETKVTVRPGEHCRYCPALRGCWAYTFPELFDDSAMDPVARVALLKLRYEQAQAKLDMHAKQEPIPQPDGRVYGPRVQVRRTINAPKAIPVLKARHPGLNVEAMSNITQADLKRAGLDSEVEMEALAQAGAVNSSEYEKMETHKP